VDQTKSKFSCSLSRNINLRGAVIVAIFLLLTTIVVFFDIGVVSAAEESSITCAVSKWQIYSGESVTVTGAITPLHAGIGVTLKYTNPADTTFNKTVTSIGNGSYSDTLLPTVDGMWSVQASWLGDADTLGNASSKVKFLVSTVKEVTIRIGQNQTLYHAFQPAIDYYYSTTSFYTIALEGSVTSPAGISLSALGGGFTYEQSQFSLGGTITSYNLTFNIRVLGGTPEGVYNATANYDIYRQSTLYPYSASLLFRYELRLRINAVGKFGASINLSLTPQVKLGGIASVSGTIVSTGGPPVTGVNVALSYMKPDGSVVNRTSMTGTNGYFEDSYIPDIPGTWSVKASWAGDQDHNGTASLEVPFTVLTDIQHQVGVYFVRSISNSIISDFIFNLSLRQIGFNVTGTSGTVGFCNITIPASLMSGSFSVFRDSVMLIKDLDYTQSYNGTHYTFRIVYTHSIHSIRIVSSEVIPEFPSFLILPVFVMATLIVMLVYRRKGVQSTSRLGDQ